MHTTKMGGAAEAAQRGRLQAPPLVLEGLTVVLHPQTDPLWLTFDPDNVLTRKGPLPLGLAGGFLHRARQASKPASAAPCCIKRW